MELDWYKIEPYTKKETEKAPDKNGIYALCTMQDNGEYKVRYVGQGNIRERLLCHLSDDDPNKELREHTKKYKMKASYAVVPDPYNRNAIELFLYNTFNPRYNKVQPPCNAPLKVNLFNLR